MTEYKLTRRHLPREGFARIESEKVDASAAATVLLEGLDRDGLDLLTHCFAAVRLFDADGNVLTSGTGDISVNIQTANNFPVWEPPANNPIDTASLRTVNWSGNTVSVRAVAAGAITGPVFWSLIVTFNQS